MRTVRVVTVLVVAVLFGAWLFAEVTSDSGGTVGSIGDGPRAFSASASAKARLSPDGTRLAIVQDGTLTVLRVRDASVVTRTGRNVVEATWMPTSDAVLVVEGPIPTGQVSTIGMNGRAVGTATLRPSVGFGNGDGLSVNSDGTRAIAITTTRDAIGGQTHRDLATIDLGTGATRVYATPETDESNPVFVNAETVAVNANGRLVFVDLADGAVHDQGRITGGPYPAPEGEALVSIRTGDNTAVQFVVGNGTRTTWLTLPKNKVPVSFQLNLVRGVFRSGDRLTVETTPSASTATPQR